MTLLLTLITASTESILKNQPIKVWNDFSQTMWTLCMHIFMIIKLPLKKSAEDSIKLSKKEKPSIGLLPTGMLKASSMHLLSANVSISTNLSEDRMNIICSLETMRKYNILAYIKNIAMDLLLGVPFVVVSLLENILKELEKNSTDSMIKTVPSLLRC